MNHRPIFTLMELRKFPKISKSWKYFFVLAKVPVCLIFVYMTNLTCHCFYSELFWINPNHLISYFWLSWPSFAYSRIVKSVQRSQVWIRPIPSGFKFIFESVESWVISSLVVALSSKNLTLESWVFYFRKG